MSSIHRALRLTLTIFALTALLPVTRAVAQTESLLHNFGLLPDGDEPFNSLVFDASGNLYTTTYNGGASNEGAVVELTPVGGGSWAESVIYSFGSTPSDGANPFSGIAFDKAGNIYGTTDGGGKYGFGTVYELSPKSGGGWTERMLHSFASGVDGAVPAATLLIDAAGNLYGTTTSGGTYASGIAFELSPRSGGGWSERILHTFGYNSKDGAYSTAALISDAAGNLYGTTVFGGGGSCNISGHAGCGIVFELSPKAGGRWAERILHTFQNDGVDGDNPSAGLILESGSLYGTCIAGGTFTFGAAFRLSYSKGAWSETVIHDFSSGSSDGFTPEAALVADSSGNLYGTASSGGANGDGVVFELLPQSGGSWNEQILHNFNFATLDGGFPYGGLVRDASGNLYGTAESGGLYFGGVAFEITP